MGGGKGADVYQSQYTPQTDTLAYETLLGVLSGRGIAPSPTLVSTMTAQQMGGKFNPNDNTITFEDGVTLKYDPQSSQFQQVGGNPDPNRLSTAQQNFEVMNSNVFSDPNSAYNLFGAFEDKQYNPATGRYEKPGAQDFEQPTAEYYLDKYAPTLKQDYQQLNYGDYQAAPYQQATYNQFDYEANKPAINTVSNISDAARSKIYQSGAKQITQQFRDRQQRLDDFVARQGNNLSSGRQQRLEDTLDRERQTEEQALRYKTDAAHELRNYDDAKRVRDLQYERDMGVLGKRGEENRYAAEFAQGEGRYATETARDEAAKRYAATRDESRYGFEKGREGALDRLKVAEAIDSGNRAKAFEELQAGRQQKLNQLTALQDMLRVYAGMDSNAAQLAAAKAGMAGSALSGLFSGVGTAASAGINKI